MEWLNKLNFKQVLKFAGLALVAIILVAIVLNLAAAPFRNWRTGVSGDMYAMPTFSGNSIAYMEEADQDSAIGLSVRNVAGMPIISPDANGTTGSDAEAYEVTDYRASIETGDLDETCDLISGLKSREDVIFENASRYDRGCEYTFKVKHDSTAGILAFVTDLEPEDLSENTRTIKNRVDDFTSQTEILENKLAAIDETLEKAIAAYDEVTVLATQSQDAGSLAKIIDSKVSIIERLTQQRINISAQLDQIGRSKAEQLDRLEYTVFNLSVRENKYFDGQSLADSWRQALREFVRDVNGIAQDISVNLIAWALYVVQYLIYFFILLFIAKHVWRLAKRIWNK